MLDEHLAIGFRVEECLLYHFLRSLNWCTWYWIKTKSTSSGNDMSASNMNMYGHAFNYLILGTFSILKFSYSACVRTSLWLLPHCAHELCEYSQKLSIKIRIVWISCVIIISIFIMSVFIYILNIQTLIIIFLLSQCKRMFTLPHILHSMACTHSCRKSIGHWSSRRNF